MSEPLRHWIDGESVASVGGTARTGTIKSISMRINRR